MLGVALLAAFVITSVTGCQQAVLEADGTDVILRRALGEDPRSIDPHKAGDVLSSSMCGMVYEQLYEFDYLVRPAALKPCLAASMPKLSDDGLTYTIELLKDVVFQDDPCFPNGRGRKMTARDVEYSVKRLAALPDSAGWWVLEHKVEGLDDWRTEAQAAGEGFEDPVKKKQAKDAVYSVPVSGLKVINDHTIEFRLVEPYPQFLFAMALSYGAVVPREAVDYYGETFFYKPVGTGPFRLRHWKLGHEIVWEKNPQYRTVLYPEVPKDHKPIEGLSPREEYLPFVGKKLPLADVVHFRILKQDQASWLEFLSGSLDNSGISKDAFSRAIKGDELTPEMKAKGIHLLKISDPTIEYVSFNMSDPVVGSAAGDKGAAIRKAVSFSLDRVEYIKRYLNGRGEPAGQLVPPGMVGHISGYSLSYAKYDPAAGRKLLEQAGYKVTNAGSERKWRCVDPATNEQVKVKVLHRREDDNDFARWLMFSGEEVGIKIEVELMTFQEFLRRQDEGNGQAYVAGWVMDYPDPQNMLQLLYGKNAGNGGINSALYRSPEYDKLYDEMKVLVQDDPVQLEKKLKLIAQMNEVLEKDAPWAPMNFRMDYSLRHKWTSPAAPNAFSYNMTKYHWADSQARATNAREWRNVPIWPAAIILGFFGLCVFLFVTKVVRQP